MSNSQKSVFFNTPCWSLDFVDQNPTSYDIAPKSDIQRVVINVPDRWPTVVTAYLRPVVVVVAVTPIPVTPTRQIRR